MKVSAHGFLKGKTMLTQFTGLNHFNCPQANRRSALRWTAAAAAVLFVTIAVPAPAVARLDPGTSGGPVQVLPEHHCPLTRIDQQFVRCGALTGAGVPAPSWVPAS